MSNTQMIIRKSKDDKGKTIFDTILVFRETKTTADSSAKSNAPVLAKTEEPVKQSPLVAEVPADTTYRIKSRYYTAYARKAMLEKNFTLAEAYTDTALQLWGNNYEACFTMAEIYEQMNNKEKAISRYQACCRIDSSRPRLYYNIAMLYLQTGNKTEAINNLSKALQLDGNYINAYMKRAAIYTDTASYDAAIADYERVFKINKSYYNAYKGRGIAYLMKRNYKQAIDDFTRYIIYDQSDPEVYYYRGLAKINNNDWLDGCLELSMSASMGYGAAAIAQKKNCE
jgi:tetratricopeptide (TPR) repeat protein